MIIGTNEIIRDYIINQTGNLLVIERKMEHAMLNYVKMRIDDIHNMLQELKIDYEYHSMRNEFIVGKRHIRVIWDFQDYGYGREWERIKI